MGAGGSSSAFYIKTVLALNERGLCDLPEIKSRSSVARYMPPNFPLETFLTSDTTAICRETWRSIIKGTAAGMASSPGKSGIVLFYDEFYWRLFERAQVMKAIFPNMKKRGEVLTLVVGSILKVVGNGDKAEVRELKRIGYNHQAKKLIRPWHFSTFCEALLETVMYWLGSDADVVVGEAWTHLLAYVLRHVLTSYLLGKIDPTEYYQNQGPDDQKSVLSQALEAANANTKKKAETLSLSGSMHAKKGSKQLKKGSGQFKEPGSQRSILKKAIVPVDSPSPPAPPAPTALVGA
ncbi:unnamed protein product [Chrysoparadoxa australica]